MAAAEAPVQAPALDELVMVRLTSIRPSPTNPRKHFDEAKLQELATSIRQKGVLQPVLLRPHPEQGAGAAIYELVAGERRVRAANLAGLAVVPAVVRRLSDRDVLEVQVVENEQREDVTALEKAEGYGRLVDRFGAAVEEIAAKVGKSASTVRGLLKLRQLPEIARAALETGALPPATAGLIARVPAPATRERLALCVLTGDQVWSAEEFSRRRPGKVRKVDPDKVLSYRDTQELIGRCCAVELKAAPFGRADTELVAEAGSCDTCPKRVGNLQKDDPDGYAGVRADVCLDPDCYRHKIAAWQDRTTTAAKAAGQRVLGPKKSNDVFYGNGGLKYDAPWVDLATVCHEDTQGKKQRTWGQLLAGHVTEDQVVLGFDHAGRLHRLVDKKQALAVIRKEHGLAARNASQSAEGTRQKREQKKEQDKRELEKTAARRCMGRVADRAEDIARRELLSGTGLPNGRGEPLLRILACGLVDAVWDDASREVLKRRGLAHAKGQVNRDALQAHIQGLPAHEVLGVMAELVAGAKLLSWYTDKEKRAALDFYGVNYQGQLDAAKKEAAAKKRDKETPHGKLQPRPASRRPIAIDRNTHLADLTLDLGDHAAQVLEAAGVVTVGDLIGRVPVPPRGGSYTSAVYSLLRNIVGLQHQAATEIGDALVDAELVLADGPLGGVDAWKPKGKAKGKAKMKGEPKTDDDPVCKVCDCWVDEVNRAGLCPECAEDAELLKTNEEEG